VRRRFDRVTVDIRVLDDPAAAVAERLAWAAEDGAHIVLTGGSTPRQAYERAASLGADWSRATLWMSDERCVPPDHEHSNWGMTKAALLDRLKGDPPRTYRMEGERGPHQGADDYEQKLGAEFGHALPVFDLLLLGLGPDVHCASLFPGDGALGEEERSVVGVETPGMAPLVPRITLTLPVLNAAREVIFLVAGEDKADAVSRAFGDGTPGPDAPASLVRPKGGALTVLLDSAAAAKLPARGS
jgi:6-phosphogluconolactonase